MLKNNVLKILNYLIISIGSPINIILLIFLLRSLPAYGLEMNDSLMAFIFLPIIGLIPSIIIFLICRSFKNISIRTVFYYNLKTRYLILSTLSFIVIFDALNAPQGAQGFAFFFSMIPLLIANIILIIDHIAACLLDKSLF